MAQIYLTHEQLAHRFAYHPPATDEKRKCHEHVREVCLIAAEEIVTLTGPSTREQSLAITKLEEAMFWANAAIARGDDI
ncbi:MAG TPA: hypothetical protein VM715_06545 [Candidatus Acidoferrum sp.]|nr:hypothetical protein [Candidatus Acidoferrum sp.]